MSDQPDALVGRVIDQRYLVENRIARGGMATVYRALDYRLERPVAVKVMHPHLAEDHQFTGRFIQEARQAARLAHPNIVNVFDQGQDGPLTYIVMEYLPGITLRELLRDFRSLTWEQTLDVTKAVLSGLDAAHTAGIVHRDLKPENILLADDGRIKIADFGLARAASHDTQTGQALLGTVAYLSPELVTGTPADVRSDLYALGIMMFEMLTGRQPFTGEQAVTIAYQHANGTVPAPSTVNATVPEELDDIVRWCTERNPEDRPAHARALLDHVYATERRIRKRLASSQQTQRLNVVQESTEADRTQVLLPPTQRVDDVLTEVLSPAERVFAGLDVPVYDATPVERERPVRKQTATHATGSSRTMALVISIVSVVALLGGGMLWWGLSQAGPQLVTVADVQGLTPVEATATLTAQQFVISPEVIEEYSTDVEEGLVIGTTPEAGTEVEEGSTISLIVSLGPNPVAVPPLVGLLLEDAQNTLEESGLVVGEVLQEFSAIQDAGVVLRAVDEAGLVLTPGQEVVLGSTVSLVVSAGEVPDVRGKSLDEARSLLQGVGLIGVPGGDGVFSDTIPEGSVVEMQITDGQVIVPGETIGLTLSRGPELVAVPNVAGKNLQDSIDALEDLGFEVDVQTDFSENLWDTPPVKVTSQDPASGQQVPKGSTVTLRSYTA